MEIVDGLVAAIVSGVILLWLQVRLVKQQNVAQEKMLQEIKTFLAHLVQRQMDHEKQLAMDLRNFQRTGRTGREGLG
jgi:uncharacterized membrane-anchored protein YhcB (DUF1043 family)